MKHRRVGGIEGFSVDVGIIALRARGRKQGQCRPQLRGRHLHDSMVRAQKPADERVNLSRGYLGYAREEDQGTCPAFDVELPRGKLTWQQ